MNYLLIIELKSDVTKRKFFKSNSLNSDTKFELLEPLKLLLQSMMGRETIKNEGSNFFLKDIEEKYHNLS